MNASMFQTAIVVTAYTRARALSTTVKRRATVTRDVPAHTVNLQVSCCATMFL